MFLQDLAEASEVQVLQTREKTGFKSPSHSQKKRNGSLSSPSKKGIVNKNQNYCIHWQEVSEFTCYIILASKIKKCGTQGHKKGAT